MGEHAAFVGQTAGPVVSSPRKYAANAEEYEPQKRRKTEVLARDDTMVITPPLVKSAITLKGAMYSAAILEGVKVVENRSRKFPLGWHALHTGKKATDLDVQRRIVSLWPHAPKDEDLISTRGCIVGAVHLSRHCTVQECHGNKWATGPVCHIIDRVVKLPTPVPHQGQLGAWTIGEPALSCVNKQLAQSHVQENDLSVL